MIEVDPVSYRDLMTRGVVHIGWHRSTIKVYVRLPCGVFGAGGMDIKQLIPRPPVPLPLNCINKASGQRSVKILTSDLYAVCYGGGKG